MKIYPAILEKTEYDVQKRLNQLAVMADRILGVHIDIMDGMFVPNATWNDVGDIERLRTTLPIQLHFMVAEPASWIPDVLHDRRVCSIIVHAETTKDAAFVRQQVGSGTRFGLAINPDTPVAAVFEHLSVLDTVMVMGVNPGASGQTFREDVLAKIEALRAKAPHIEICVDGGVNDKNAQKIKEKGADILVAASYLWNAASLTDAIERLRGT